MPFCYDVRRPEQHFAQIMHATDATVASTGCTDRASSSTASKHSRRSAVSKKHRDVAHAPAHNGIARILHLRGNLSSGANFLPALNEADSEVALFCRAFLTALSES